MSTGNSAPGVPPSSTRPKRLLAAAALGGTWWTARDHLQADMPRVSPLVAAAHLVLGVAFVLVARRASEIIK